MFLYIYISWITWHIVSYAILSLIHTSSITICTFLPTPPRLRQSWSWNRFTLTSPGDLLIYSPPHHHHYHHHLTIITIITIFTSIMIMSDHCDYHCYRYKALINFAEIISIAFTMIFGSLPCILCNFQQQNL